jgi:hypothetical protein
LEGISLERVQREVLPGLRDFEWVNFDHFLIKAPGVCR